MRYRKGPRRPRLLAAGISLTAVAAQSADSQPSSAMSQVGMVRTGSGSFSLDVEGADLRTVLRAISEFSGRNIVHRPERQGHGHASRCKNVGVAGRASQPCCARTVSTTSKTGGHPRVDEAVQAERREGGARDGERAHARSWCRSRRASSS